MFDTHHHTFVMEYKIPRVIPNVSYGLWVISRFINDNKFTPIIHSVDSGGDYVCVGTGGILELSVLSAQFCYETKNYSKNKVYFKNSMCRDPGAKWTINLENLSYLILKLIKTLKNLTLVLL